MNITSFLPEKMTATVDGTAVRYDLLGCDLNACVGQTVRLAFTGHTCCLGCQAKDVELDDGHCEQCNATLASQDLCRVKPELCHYAQGTCRQPSWGESNCLTAHVLYVSNTSGVKVGITREKNVADRSRWIDQGATQALPFLRVDSRLTAGQIEVAIAAVMADKTNWRTMLKGNGDAVDLTAMVGSLREQFATEFALYGDRVLSAVDAEVVGLDYPVRTFPEKVGNAWSVSKNPVLEGVLVGVKGQYVMIDVAGKIEVLNIRKYAGHELNFSAK